MLLLQEPHLEKAINSVRFVAQHVKNQDRYNKVYFINVIYYDHQHHYHNQWCKE